MRRVCMGCVLQIGEQKLNVDLVALEMKGYDVIFGMNLQPTFSWRNGLFQEMGCIPIIKKGSFQLHK